MKKLLLSTILLVFTSSLIAQDETPKNINYGNRIDKGTVLLTGGISFDSDFEDNSGFNFQAGTQFALSQRFTFNIGINYLVEKTHSVVVGAADTYQTNIFEITPGATVYGKIQFGWLQPYLEIGVPIGFLSTSEGEHATGIGAGLIPGLNVYLSRKLAFSASIGLLQYSKIKYKDSDETDDSISLGFTPNAIKLGIVWILGGK